MEPDFSRYPLHFVCASWRGCLCTPVVALAFSVVLSSRSLGRPAGPGPGGGVFSIALPLSWWWAGSEYKPRKCLHLSLRGTCFFFTHLCSGRGGEWLQASLSFLQQQKALVPWGRRKVGAEALLSEGSFLWVSFYPSSFFGAPSRSFENYRPLLCL